MRWELDWIVLAHNMDQWQLLYTWSWSCCWHRMREICWL